MQATATETAALSARLPKNAAAASGNLSRVTMELPLHAPAKKARSSLKESGPDPQRSKRHQHCGHFIAMLHCWQRARDLMLSVMIAGGLQSHTAIRGSQQELRGCICTGWQSSYLSSRALSQSLCTISAEVCRRLPELWETANLARHVSMPLARSVEIGPMAGIFSRILGQCQVGQV